MYIHTHTHTYKLIYNTNLVRQRGHSLLALSDETKQFPFGSADPRLATQDGCPPLSIVRHPLGIVLRPQRRFPHSVTYTRLQPWMRHNIDLNLKVP